MYGILERRADSLKASRWKVAWRHVRAPGDLELQDVGRRELRNRVNPERSAAHQNDQGAPIAGAGHEAESISLRRQDGRQTPELGE
jgi:hypothetical protein